MRAAARPPARNSPHTQHRSWYSPHAGRQGPCGGIPRPAARLPAILSYAIRGHAEGRGDGDMGQRRIAEKPCGSSAIRVRRAGGPFRRPEGRSHSVAPGGMPERLRRGPNLSGAFAPDLAPTRASSPPRSSVSSVIQSTSPDCAAAPRAQGPRAAAESSSPGNLPAPRRSVRDGPADLPDAQRARRPANGTRAGAASQRALPLHRLR